MPKGKPTTTSSPAPVETLAENPTYVEDVMNAVQFASEGATEVNMPVLRRSIYVAMMLGVTGHVDLHQVDASLSGTYTSWSTLRNVLQTFIRDSHSFPHAPPPQHDEDDDAEAEEQPNAADVAAELANVRSLYESNAKLPEALRHCLKTEAYPLDGNPSVMMRTHAVLSKLPSVAYDVMNKDRVHLQSLLILTCVVL